MSRSHRCSTPGGIDIRDNAGLSLGDRKPLPNKQTKLETLPIASLVLTLSEQSNAVQFFSHWAEVTCTSVEEVLVESLPSECSAVPSASKHTANDPYYPRSFFDKSRSKRAMPFTALALRTKGYATYLSKAKQHLPANPGDLLWLIDRFFTANFSEGGVVDLISASLHNNSVFRLVALFCTSAMYKHHPHLITLLAFASMAEMGQDERNVASNALTAACELLRASEDRKAKTANLRGGGTASRYVIALEGDQERPKNAIRKVAEPKPEDFERDIEILEDLTDDDADWDKDSMASDDEATRDDVGEESGRPAAKATGKESQHAQNKGTKTKASDSRAATAGKKRSRDEDADDREGLSKKARKAPETVATAPKAAAKATRSSGLRRRNAESHQSRLG